ncbi:MAG TPA: hypothetical protein VNE42_04620 [Acidimicrobiales bacterium]|nr:hypothetical protein [Acidimicrobiales bacterium]
MKFAGAAFPHVHSYRFSRAVSLVISITAAVVVVGYGTSFAATSSRKSSAPSQATTKVIAGTDGYCAIVGSGGVMCWGDNSYGELGSGSKLDFSAVPVAVKGLHS